MAEKGLPRKFYVKSAEQKGILNDLIKKYNIKTAPERNDVGWYKNDDILKKLIEECNHSSKEFQKKYTHIFQDMGREYLTNLGLKFHQRQNKSFENYDYCMSVAMETNNDGTRKYPNIRSAKSLGIFRGMKKQGLWEKFKLEAWP